MTAPRPDPAPDAHGHDPRRRRGRHVRRRRAARALPATDGRVAAPGRGRRRAVVRAQPARRRSLALRVRRRPPGRTGRLQPRAPRRRDHGPLPGRHGRHRRRPRERRPRAGVGPRQPRRARRVDRLGVGRAGAGRRVRAARRRARRTSPADRRRDPRRPAARPRPLHGQPDARRRRGHRPVRRRQHGAGGREPLEVLHGRGVLGAGPPAPAVPGRRLRRGRRSHRQLPGDATRRRRGPLAADPRPLGRLRPVRDGDVPRARRPRAAHRRRARLRPPPGRAVRQPGALGQPAGRAVGIARARHDGARAAAATASSARR